MTRVRKIITLHILLAVIVVGAMEEQTYVSPYHSLSEEELNNIERETLAKKCCGNPASAKSRPWQVSLQELEYEMEKKVVQKLSEQQREIFTTLEPHEKTELLSQPIEEIKNRLSVIKKEQEEVKASFQLQFGYVIQDRGRTRQEEKHAQSSAKDDGQNESSDEEDIEKGAARKDSEEKDEEGKREERNECEEEGKGDEQKEHEEEKIVSEQKTKDSQSQKPSISWFAKWLSFAWWWSVPSIFSTKIVGYFWKCTFFSRFESVSNRINPRGVTKSK